MRLGYNYQIKVSKFSVYSIFSFGDGLLSTSVFGKNNFNYDYISGAIGLSYTADSNLFSDKGVFKIEFGYKRSYFDNQYFQKELIAYQNDYTIGIGGSFQIDFKEPK